MSANFQHHPQDISSLKHQCINQLDRLLPLLFSDKRIVRMAHEYRVGTQGSISIRRADGSYFNHETGKGGDILDLIQDKLKTNFNGALVFVRGFLGNHAGLQTASPSNSLLNKIDERAAHQRDKALAMIKRASPLKGTRAETFLREKRGISVEPLPTSLQFIEHAYNFTADGFYPAMIATISDLGGEAIAAHCTFLDPATGGKLKGDGIKSRLIFGSYRGGAIRLAEATDRLALCEGIEDGLSILQCSDWPVWACAGTSGLRAVQIPKTVSEVMICADRDDAGMQAANDLSVRLLSEGKKVRIAMPPEGVKDFNELLRKGVCYAK